jgi:2-haloacid dehalogenase
MEQLLGTWDRVQPWPDVSAGLARIRTIGVISPLSNGSFATVTHIARAGGLPWE